MKARSVTELMHIVHAALRTWKSREENFVRLNEAFLDIAIDVDNAGDSDESTNRRNCISHRAMIFSPVGSIVEHSRRTSCSLASNSA